MLTKTLCVLLVAVCLQLCTAEEKFDSHKELMRHGVFEFVKATYGSIEKGFDLTENLTKDLRAYEPKTEADEDALRRLEIYLDKVEKIKGTAVNDENLDEKLEIVLSSVVAAAKYKTTENENVLKSPAVMELIKKYNFEEVRQEFLNDFKTFAEHYTKEVEDFLGYAEEDKIADMGDWFKKFNAEDDLAKKLHLFIDTFVNENEKKIK